MRTKYLTYGERKRERERERERERGIDFMFKPQ